MMSIQHVGIGSTHLTEAQFGPLVRSLSYRRSETRISTLQELPPMGIWAGSGLALLEMPMSLIEDCGISMYVMS